MAGGVKVEFIYGGELFCESMDEYKQKIKNIFLSFVTLHTFLLKYHPYLSDGMVLDV